MVSSMTGYGRCQQVIDSMNITVEVKSVNHRYFEFNARTPRQYMFLEEKLKKFFQSKLSRGKIECFVTVESLDESDCKINVKANVAKAYLDALNEISSTFGIKNNVTSFDLTKYPDVLSMEKAEPDAQKIWNAVETVASVALDNIVKMRQIEGEKLQEDVFERIETILNNVQYIEKRSPETVKEYTFKLLERMKEVLEDVNVDEQRILTEAAIYADKVAVAEETVRLRSHITQLKEMFESTVPVGRKMDFIVQEMNREANTIGSKAQDVEIAKRVVDIKSEIEKIREQIQNIE